MSTVVLQVLTPLNTQLDWLSFPTAILPQWRQTLEFQGGIFGIQLAENYFDGALNILPIMPPMIEPFDQAVHGNNDGNRTNRKLAESNYALQAGFATIIVNAERNFRAGIIGAIESHHLDAAMALTPTGATFPTPTLALHGIPAPDIIPAILALARSISQNQIGSIIAELSKPFTCTASDSADKFVFQYRRLVSILTSNQQSLAPFQLRDFFLLATNANFEELLRPYYAFTASSPTPDLAAHISAFLSARPAFNRWLEIQTHAPTALAAVAKSTTVAATTRRPFYCWTHGHGYHQSSDCKIKDSNNGHQTTATKANTMGGTTRIAEFRPTWKPK